MALRIPAVFMGSRGAEIPEPDRAVKFAIPEIDVEIPGPLAAFDPSVEVDRRRGS
jgi:hypothetical protein